MNTDDQLTNYIDGLAPAIRLEDITGASHSDITILPTSLEGEQITMTDLHDQHPNHDNVHEIALTDRAAAKRRNRLSIWAGGAVAAAAAVAAIGFALTGTDGAKTTTTTDASAASEFTESDGSGTPEDDSSEQASAEFDTLTDTSNGYLVRAGDGDLINYITTFSFTGDTQTTAERSADGENWEPIEVNGLDGQLLGVTQQDGLMFAMVAPAYDMSEPDDQAMMPHAEMSTDGLNWTVLSAPEATTSSDGIAVMTDVTGAVPLADGRILVAGVQFPDIDYGAFGFDDDNYCGESMTSESDGETTATIDPCDGTNEAVTIEAPMGDPAEILWTVNADGTNPTPVSIPRDDLHLEFGSMSKVGDAVEVYFIQGENDIEARFRGTTTDAENWDFEEVSNDEIPYWGPASTYGDTTVRIAHIGNSNRLQVSVDGGQTFTDTAPLGADGFIENIAAGPAGVVAIWTAIGEDGEYPEYDAPSFDYTAADGTNLIGEFPDVVATTWVLTTPGGETYEYELDDSIFHSEPPTSGDRNVIMNESGYGEPSFTVLSPVDGSELLTVSFSDLFDAMPMDEEEMAMEEAMGSMSASVEKDDYTLTIEGLDAMEAAYTLYGPDGSELLVGTLDEEGNPSGDGVELLGEEMIPSLRFFDPVTGEDWVTFDAMDMMNAMANGATDAMATVSEPFSVTQDGYILNGAVPAGEWTVANPNGETIATFESPLSVLYFGGSSVSSDDDVRSVDPLTKDVTILADGEPVVTFAFDDIVAGSESLSYEFGFGAPGGAILFSGDQGATWQELSPLNGWVTSVAVGDDEVLVTLGEGGGTPIRLPVSAN